jgi:hypothetical protein
MHKFVAAIALGTIAFAATGCVQDNAQASNARERNSKVYVGALTCDVAGGTGYLIASSRKMDCVFEPMSGGRQAYEGELRGFGLELGYTKPMKMLWKVYTVGSNKGPTAVAGTFVGEAGGVTVDRSMAGDWLYGGQDGAAAMVGTTYFAASGQGYELEYAVAEVHLKMKAGPVTVQPATSASAAESVPNAPALKQAPKK